MMGSTTFFRWICLSATIGILHFASAEDVTLYEYYASPSVKSGLVPTPDGFELNGRQYWLMSGAIHYFRVHPAYWRDRLRKLRAAGLNAVETYVPFNLHAPKKGVYDFGNGGNDMSAFLDIDQFIRIAQEEDLFVIVRPGPYICAEWEFGGLPSWLLRDSAMQVRTSDPRFMEVVTEYFNQLLPLLAPHQFQNNGSIIAFQIENEYGHFGYSDQPRDKEYLLQLKQLMEANGLKEMFFTSDTPSQTLDWGSLPGVLQTANFGTGTHPAKEFDVLDVLQPNMPRMVAEYWTGWFDHWLEPVHETRSVESFATTLEQIFQYNASVNLYMFHGGTSFGFMNGANKLPVFPQYVADVNSYDYDAPLSEAGDYTDKYLALKDLVEQYQPVKSITPPMPDETAKVAYLDLELSQYILLDSALSQNIPVVASQGVQAMEDLPINDDNGQSYGYILYRQNAVELQDSSALLIRGHVQDLALVRVDDETLTKPFHSALQIEGFGYWIKNDGTLHIKGRAGTHRLDIMVENMGRSNFGTPDYFIQKKGLWQGPVLLDDKELNNWNIYPLELKSSWIKNLNGWAFDGQRTAPIFLQGVLHISGTPSDTFINTEGLGRGVIFVNGFNVGRFSSVGPTQSLYVPAPLLRTGDNKIVIFDMFNVPTTLKFSDKPLLGPAINGNDTSTPPPVTTSQPVTDENSLPTSTSTAFLSTLAPSITTSSLLSISTTETIETDSVTTETLPTDEATTEDSSPTTPASSPNQKDLSQILIFLTWLTVLINLRY